MIVEITDKTRIGELLAEDRLAALESLDENALGVEGIVSVFAEDEPRPPNQLVVRWSQAAMGLRSAAQLVAGRLTGLGALIEALPEGRGAYDLALPFWTSAAVGSVWRARVEGAEAIYVLERGRRQPSPVARQCERVTDPHLLRPKFRKLAEDMPSYVLSLRGALVSVAVVTHLRDGIARLDAYTVEEARGRGFARGAVTALAEDLEALRIVPSLRIDLGHEPSVRLAEGIGFVQRASFLRARLDGREMAGQPAEGLVRIGQP